MIKVAYIHQRLAHYRLPLFNRIYEQCKNFDLRVYCGGQKEREDTSGILVEHDPSFVRRVRNHEVRLGSKNKIIIQWRTIVEVLRWKPDVMIFEANMHIWSSLLLLLIRRMQGRKNIMWLKGWPRHQNEHEINALGKRFFLMLADKYIVYGHKSEDSLKRYGVDSRKVIVSQNTVYVQRLLTDSAQIEVQKADSENVKEIIESGKKIVFYIGRHVEKKSIGDLLHAFSRLSSTDNASSTVLVIAGRGPTTKSLIALSHRLNSESIRFLGRISDNDAELLFLHASIFVSPGATGLAINQAMAAGCASICADEIGPDSELLIHNVNGLRYEKGNIDALASAMARVLSDAHLREELGSAARRTIAKKATVENMVNQHKKAILSVYTDSSS